MRVTKLQIPGFLEAQQIGNEDAAHGPTQLQLPIDANAGGQRPKSQTLNPKPQTLNPQPQQPAYAALLSYCFEPLCLHFLYQRRVSREERIRSIIGFRILRLRSGTR